MAWPGMVVVLGSDAWLAQITKSYGLDSLRYPSGSSTTSLAGCLRATSTPSVCRLALSHRVRRVVFDGDDLGVEPIQDINDPFFREAVDVSIVSKFCTSAPKHLAIVDVGILGGVRVAVKGRGRP